MILRVHTSNALAAIFIEIQRLGHRFFLVFVALLFQTKGVSSRGKLGHQFVFGDAALLAITTVEQSTERKPTHANQRRIQQYERDCSQPYSP